MRFDWHEAKLMIEAHAPRLKEAARNAGIPTYTLHQYLQGKKDLPHQKLIALFTVLGYTKDDYLACLK